MRDGLDRIAERHGELEAQLADPDVHADASRYATLARQHARLGQVLTVARRIDELDGDLEAARQLATGASADAGLLAAEVAALEAERATLDRELTDLLIPPDPDDDRDVILEVRAAAGGDEAGLFAGELLDLYVAYARRQGWTANELSRTAQGIGGIKEAIVEIVGAQAFAHLKHESGVHRVQRVPATESQGRIHTSTASVAVLPAAAEIDVAIAPADLRIDVFRSSGPGGQSVNTTDSAVRVTHLPTGIVVSCQDEKSQHQNRDKALRILRARLLEAERERVDRERADARRGQIGSGDRSEKIRTYNFPQSRVTDHRIGLSVHDLAGLMAGGLDPFVDALRSAERTARLASLEGATGPDDGSGAPGA